MTETQEDFTLFGIQAALPLVLCLILALFSKTEKRYLIAVFVVFAFASMAILYIPQFPFVSRMHLNWNWQGKLISCLLPVAFIAFLPFLTMKQAGFTWKVNKSVWWPMVILLVISTAYNLYLSDGLAGGDRTKEYLFFQISLPGLSEETIYRGILLGLLNLVFVARRTIVGASMGWGSLIISIMFGVGHALYFDDNHHLQFLLENFTITFVLGLFMAYLREKGESIIPSLVFHNLFNAGPSLLRLFF